MAIDHDGRLPRFSWVHLYSSVDRAGRLHTGETDRRNREDESARHVDGRQTQCSHIGVSQCGMSPGVTIRRFFFSHELCNSFAYRGVASVIKSVLVVDSRALAPCVGFHAFAVHRRAVAGMVVLIPALQFPDGLAGFLKSRIICSNSLPSIAAAKGGHDSLLSTHKECINIQRVHQHTKSASTHKECVISKLPSRATRNSTTIIRIMFGSSESRPGLGL